MLTSNRKKIVKSSTHPTIDQLLGGDCFVNEKLWCIQEKI